MILAAALFMLATFKGAANASHEQHAYSEGFESSTSYTGVRATRWDRGFTGLSSDGCSEPFDGHPIYQTQWVFITSDASDWIELGTGAQCDDDYRYWFYGYGYNGSWNPIEVIDHDPVQKHQFTIHRETSSTWYFYIDVTKLSYGLNWSVSGTEVVVGLETYDEDAKLSGSVLYSDNENLQYHTNLWYDWTEDGKLVDSPLMCGTFLSDNEYRYGINTSC